MTYGTRTYLLADQEREERLVARAEKAEAAERQAHEAMLSNDERHASDMASVRARAEKAEARATELESHLAGVEGLERINEDGYERDIKALRNRVEDLEDRLRQARERVALLEARQDLEPAIWSTPSVSDTTRTNPKCP